MENNQGDNNTLREEDNQSDLPDKAGNTRRLQAYAVILFGIIIIALIVITFLKNIGEDEVEEVKKEPVAKNKVAHKEFKLEKKEMPSFLKKVELPTPTIERPKFELVEKDLPAYTPAGRAKSLKPNLIKGSSNVLVKNIGKNSSTSVPDNSINNGTQLGIGSIPEALGTDSDYVGDTFTPTVARMNRFNPSLLLPKGTYIGCSLNTRLISDIKGGISCTVSDSIYSSDGKVLLIERGSKITGAFKQGQTNDGSNRIFAVWQEIRTPNHLVIPVYSGASDTLGSSGIEGEINHKWMLRFGSAVLLSAIDDIFNVLAYNLNGGNNNEDDKLDYSENTRDNAKNMAGVALENFINIKPTIYKNQGDLVGVYVNRDIDFSKVYRLKKTNARLIK